jgi:hypothetical protein
MTNPILPDTTPVFDERIKVQFYSLRDGHAHDPEQATFKWNHGLYVHAAGGMRGVAAFSVRPFEAGDDIVRD